MTMKYFVITTSKETADLVEKHSEWVEKMGDKPSWKLGKIIHNDGWSDVQIVARDGSTIEPKDIFFLGLHSGFQKQYP